MITRTFHALAGDAERTAFSVAVRLARQRFIALREQVAPEHWYTPRYHGWSLAGMFDHVHSIDQQGLLQLRLAVLGFAPPTSRRLLDRVNDVIAARTVRRPLEQTIARMTRYEPVVLDWVSRLPEQALTRRVHYPSAFTYVTVEQGINLYFLHHYDLHRGEVEAVENGGQA